MGERVALLIGCSRYDDPELSALSAPLHDISELAVVLKDPHIGGFNVDTLADEPAHTVGRAIGEFFAARQRDDLALLYFSGHGLKDDHDGQLYLATPGTVKDRPAFTAVSARSIDASMERCRAGQKVLILDCCYSGSFPSGTKGDPEVHTFDQFRGKGRVVLTASDRLQYSYEAQDASGIGRPSLFTRHLIAGMKEGGADANGKGVITLDELYQYAFERVVAENERQHPKKKSDVEGEIIIARNPTWTLPARTLKHLTDPSPRIRRAALDELAVYRESKNERVRAAATAEITLLLDDDSREVATAARKLLDEDVPVPGAAESEASVAASVPTPPSAATQPAPCEPLTGRAPPVAPELEVPFIDPPPGPGHMPTPSPGRRRAVAATTATMLIAGVSFFVLHGRSHGQYPPQSQAPAPETVQAAASKPGGIVGDPAQFVLAYYSLLPNRDRDQAWSRLTRAYQAQVGGRAAYESFYDSVARILFDAGPTTVSPTKVIATIRFVLRSGDVSSKAVPIYLIPVDGSYLVDVSPP